MTGATMCGILHALCFLMLCVSIEASLAAMSIDLGSQFIKAGIVKPGVPLEIVLNKESGRKTANLISIRNGERLLGGEAAQIGTRYPISVFSHILQLIGKSPDHPSVAIYKQRFPHANLITNQNGSLAFIDGSRELTPSILLSMILAHMKKETENHAEQPVTDCVIAIPPFFAQRERAAILSASEVAGLNVLQLINSGTAAALSWGAFHRKEIDGKVVRMLVYDMGSTQTTATLVEFSADANKQSQMRVMGTGFDRDLGGLEMTVRLREHIIDRYEKETKTSKPLRSNARSLAKVHVEAERVKQVLSANTEHVAQIESVHEDANLRMHVTRVELEKLVEDLAERIIAPFHQALRIANIDIALVEYVVLMGAATRMPFVQNIIQAAAKKELGRFLNTDEAIAMGALFQAAHLSKGFRVKALPVVDSSIYPIIATFNVTQEDGTFLPRESSLFPPGSPFPSPNPKNIAFKSFQDDFSFSLYYGNFSHLTKQQIVELGDVSLLSIAVKGVPSARDMMKEGDEWRGVKVSFRLDPSGILKAKQADANMQRPRGPIQTLSDKITGFFSGKEEEKKENGEEEEKKEEEERARKEEEVEKREGDNKEKDSEKKERKNGVKVDNTTEKESAAFPSNETVTQEKTMNNTNPKVDVTVKEGMVRVKLSMVKKNLAAAQALSKEEIREAKRMLIEFNREEAARTARAAAQNNLEGLVFDSSVVLDEDVQFAAAVSEAEKEIILKTLNEARNWLEEDAGPTTPTEQFNNRIATIKEAMNSVKKRIKERKAVPEELEKLGELVKKVEAILKENEEKEGVEEDRKKLTERLAKNTEWAESSQLLLDKPANVDLDVSSAEVRVKIETLKEAARAFRRKIQKAEEVKKKKAAEEAKEAADKKKPPPAYEEGSEPKAEL